MRRQCHFGKVNSSLCSSVDTGAAATLCYAIYGTWSDDCHTSYDTNAMTQTRLIHQTTTFYLRKFVIFECIQVPQLGLVN